MKVYTQVISVPIQKMGRCQSHGIWRANVLFIIQGKAEIRKFCSGIQGFPLEIKVLFFSFGSSAKSQTGRQVPDCQRK